MITLAAIIAAGTIGIAIGRISSRSNKNSVEAKPVTKLALPTPTPSHQPSVIQAKSEPEPKHPTVSSRSDVKDIRSAYEYLCYRTDALDRLTDACNPVHELDAFIKENMVDLRDCEGLVCSDGINLLQYSVDRHKFSLIRMKSPNVIMEYRYNLKGVREKLQTKWDDITLSLVVSHGPKALFDCYDLTTVTNCSPETSKYLMNHGRYVNFDNSPHAYDPRWVLLMDDLKDPISDFRKSDSDIEFHKCFLRGFKKELQKFHTDAFANQYTFCIDDNDNLYMMLDQTGKEQKVFLVSEEKAKIFKQYNGGTEFDFMFEHRKEILAARPYGTRSSALNLMFVAFPKQ